MKEREEDVVVVQELFNFRHEVIDGMAEAGFCHYVATPFGVHGSGLAIFSKHSIDMIDFIDWFDKTGPNSEAPVDPESLWADKGVMYARIKKDDENYHVFNTHTQSDSLRSWGLDTHRVRLGQFSKMRTFVEKKVGWASIELVLLSGDFNEDKKNTQFYEDMMGILYAGEPVVKGKYRYTYDTSKNPFLNNVRVALFKRAWRWIKQFFWPASKTDKVQEFLDYVLVSRRGKQPRKAHCEILKPQWPKDCGEENCMVSDHFPNTCTFETHHFP